jgi:hypothetical protein
MKDASKTGAEEQAPEPVKMAAVVVGDDGNFQVVNRASPTRSCRRCFGWQPSTSSPAWGSEGVAVKTTIDVGGTVRVRRGIGFGRPPPHPPPGALGVSTERRFKRRIGRGAQAPRKAGTRQRGRPSDTGSQACAPPPGWARAAAHESSQSALVARAGATPALVAAERYVVTLVAIVQVMSDTTPGKNP